MESDCPEQKPGHAGDKMPELPGIIIEPPQRVDVRIKYVWTERQHKANATYLFGIVVVVVIITVVSS